MPLQEEIADILRMPENGAGAPSLDTIESTLTNGYAEALSLEAKCSRITRRLGEVARDGADEEQVREFARLSRCLETADRELERLRSLLRTLQARRRLARATDAA